MTSCSSLPLRIAIALDTSQSMGGENLQRAQEACRAVVAQLRDRDRLSLAGFSTSVTPLLQSLPGGAAALQPANTAISQLTAGGTKRLTPRSRSRAGGNLDY
ncbi:MAG: VWA domain-containing protein [Oscillatoriales cyanobacterium]|nr:MAG: VWA domain-containing protein [Oscillatoriales cyanobacterium]